MVVNVKNRIKQFRFKIESISGDTRNIIKDNLRDVFDVASLDAYTRMVEMTPQRSDEHPDVYKWRLKTQPYLIQQSPNRSISLYGMTLKQGWIPPKIDFIGSTKNTINISTQINNRAPHASMALLGHYTKFGWEIAPRYTKAIMFDYMNKGKPFVSKLPQMFRPPHTLGRRDIIQTGFEIINSYRSQMLKSLIDSMVQYT